MAHYKGNIFQQQCMYWSYTESKGGGPNTVWKIAKESKCYLSTQNIAFMISPLPNSAYLLIQSEFSFHNKMKENMAKK